MKPLTCPDCSGPAVHVVSGGLPGKICTDEECAAGWGLAFWVHAHLGYPFTGIMVAYEGWWRYPVALWHWLTTDEF